MTVIRVGRPASASMLVPCSMADIAMASARLRAADAARRPDDVGALDMGAVHVEMPGRHGQVDRLHHHAALPVQHAEAVRDLQDVAEGGDVAVAPARSPGR